MSSDFSALGRLAAGALVVPDVPIAAIRDRVRAIRRREQLGLIGASAAIALAIVAGGTGAGAKLADGVRVWLSGGNVVMAIHSGVIMREPDAAALRREIAHATFPIVFPVGLPAGTRAQNVTLTPLGLPSVISIAYDGPGFKGAFTLVDPAVINGDRVSGATGSLPVMKDADHWRVGGEVVIVRRGAIPAAILARIKAAMAASSPRASFDATGALLPQLVVVGGDVRLDVAEKLGPPSPHRVLIGKQGMATIPRLATRSEPLLDRRVWHLSSITYRNGDIRTASMTKVSGAAISAAGVRAIGAVLRSRTAGASRCDCEVLFDQPNAKMYRVWTIPLRASSGEPRSYAVDARTFAITP